MKTTVEIPDALLERARLHARRSGRPVRALIDDELRLVLQAGSARVDYRLPDRSVGVPGAPNPLETMSWRDLRDEVAAGR